MATEKIILEASTFPRVDIDFMNKTHFDELVIVQALGKLISNYQEHETSNEVDAQHITQAIDSWIDHSRAHFYRENALMQEVEFPMYHVHYGEHERVLDEMLRIITNWKDNQNIDIVADYVFTSWPNWFNNHVNTMDLITAQFAVMNGYSPNSTPSL